LSEVKNAFRQPSDILHAILGFACAVLRKYFMPFSLLIALVFIIYEAWQAEDRETSIEDLCEMLTGFALGVILLP